MEHTYSSLLGLQPDLLLKWIPIFPLIGAFLNGILGRRFPRWLVYLIGCSAIFLSALFAVDLFFTFKTLANDSASLNPNIAISTTLFPWINVADIQLDVRFVFDRLSSIMTLLVTCIGFLIHLYSVGYMSHDASYSRFFAYLNLFCFAMLILVLGDSMPLLFVGWEGVGLCSYLLIGFWFTDSENAAAGKKAFVVNRIGDVGFILAMLSLFAATGTLNFVELDLSANAGLITSGIALFAAMMIILGACGKSAQIPLFVWLPDAMAGPTPVSALIHAATMVTAGVYLCCRMNFLFALAPLAMLILAFIGAFTAIFAASIALVQNDIKKVLAYSTVSQLGFMFVAVGVGAYSIALFHVLTHAFFKACLFLGAGSVIHGMSGEQDMRLMGGLKEKMPITFWTFLIATFAITAVLPLSGFMSKDAILMNAFFADSGDYAAVFSGSAKIIWVLITVAAVMTSFYMWRLVFMTFFSGETRASEKVVHHVHESPWQMTVPLIVLAFLALFGGCIGVPHILSFYPSFGFGEDWIVNWLKPILGSMPMGHPAKSTEFALMGLSVLGAWAGLALAYSMYFKSLPELKVFDNKILQWFSNRLENKWHVDELYEGGVVQPLKGFSNNFFYKVFDRSIIDGGISALAQITYSLGVLGKPFQGGKIQNHLVLIVLILLLFLFFIFTGTSVVI